VREYDALDIFTSQIPLQPKHDDGYELIVVEMGLDGIFPLVL